MCLFIDRDVCVAEHSNSIHLLWWTTIFGVPNIVTLDRSEWTGANLFIIRSLVPQGSILGPILFLFYTQPLSQIIDRHSVSYSEFADDSQLYDSVPREQLDSLLSNSPM